MDPDRRLSSYRAIWEDKPVLRAIYSDYYRHIVAACTPGPTLEIGGGSGNLKEFARQVISTDILPAPWLDAIIDAQFIPFRDGVFNNIVMVDVLHHIERPILFLREAVRLLRQGGRVILVEPGITPISWIFYSCFHPESVRLNVNPFADIQKQSGRDPFDANQALPTLLFRYNRTRLEKEISSIKLRKIQNLSLLAYPLSGGFRQWSLVPTAFVGPLLKMEELFMPVLGPLMAFRLLVILERV